MTRAITRQQQQNFNSKTTENDRTARLTQNLQKASRAKSWAAYIQELRHEWEDTP